MRITDVLKIEETNYRNIYLYFYQNRVWGCCCKSALLLHGLYPNIPYRNKNLSGFIRPVMVIDNMTLGDLLEKLPPIDHTQLKIVIELPDSLVFI